MVTFMGVINFPARTGTRGVAQNSRAVCGV
jgi:hypothetical protein